MENVSNQTFVSFSKKVMPIVSIHLCNIASTMPISTNTIPLFGGWYYNICWQKCHQIRGIISRHFNLKPKSLRNFNIKEVPHQHSHNNSPKRRKEKRSRIQDVPFFCRAEKQDNFSSHSFFHEQWPSKVLCRQPALQWKSYNITLTRDPTRKSS